MMSSHDHQQGSPRAGKMQASVAHNAFFHEIGRYHLALDR